MKKAKRRKQAKRRYTKPVPIEPRAVYRTSEAIALTRRGRSQVYPDIRAGKLRCIRSGRCRLFRGQAILDYLTILESESRAA